MMLYNCSTAEGCMPLNISFRGAQMWESAVVLVSGYQASHRDLVDHSEKRTQGWMSLWSAPLDMFLWHCQYIIAPVTDCSAYMQLFSYRFTIARYNPSQKFKNTHRSDSHYWKLAWLCGKLQVSYKLAEQPSVTAWHVQIDFQSAMKVCGCNRHCSLKTNWGK